MTFPQSLLGNKVEIYYDSAWHDISSDVRGVGAEDGEITIGQRGQPDQSSGLTPTTAELSVNNRDGKYSPRNTSSELYGKIGPNTPLRISADLSSTTDVTTTSVTHIHTAAGQTQSTNTSTTITDFDITLTGVAVAALPLSDSVTVSILGRVDNLGAPTDYVRARLIFTSANTVQVALDSVVDGVVTSTSATAISGALATETMSVRFQAVGRTIRVRAWETANTQPSTWDQSTTTTHLTSGAYSVRSATGASLTNPFPYNVTFQSIFYSLGIILFTGEIAEFPKKWDSTGTDVWVTLQASGLTRRLLQGKRPLGSALYRAMQRTDLIGYWAFENLQGDRTTHPSIASSLDGGSSLIDTDLGDFNGTAVDWSGDDSLIGSDSLPVLSMASEAFSVMDLANAPLLPPSSTLNDTFSVAFWMYSGLPGDNPDPRTNCYVEFDIDNGTFGYANVFASHEEVLGVKTTYLSFTAETGSAWTYTTTIPYENRWHFYRFTMKKTAPTFLTIYFYVDEVLKGSNSVNTGATAFTGQPSKIRTFSPDTDSSAANVSFGHFAIASGITNDDIALRGNTIYEAGFLAHAGETAVERFTRLCDEESVYIEITESEEDTGTLLGPQANVSFVDAMDDIALADGGVLFELRSEFGYGYKTRASLYNLSPSLTLNYTATDLSEVPESTDDDSLTVNQFTATRKAGGGAGATVTQTTGPMSTADPRDTPPGVGVYPDGEEVNVYADDQLADFAGWRVHLGTWDESRWPAISVALHRTPFTGDQGKLASAAFLDVAEVMSIVNTPDWIGQDSVILQTRSVSLHLSNFTWAVSWNALPAGPWNELGIIENVTYGRLDTSGSTLVSAVDTDDTELVVFTDEVEMPYSVPMWTEDIAELDSFGTDGIDLRLNPASRAGGRGGERVTVPATISRQDTFTRSGQLSGSAANTGQVWVNTDGTATDATTDGTRAVFVHPTAGTGGDLWQTLPGPGINVAVSADVAFNKSTPSGTQGLQAFLIMRQTDVNNYVAIRLTLQTSGTVELGVSKVVGGSQTILATTVPQFQISGYTANAIIKVKGMVYRRNVYAKMWLSTSDEPDWQWVLPDVLKDIVSGSDVALYSARVFGNTDADATIYWDNLKVITPKITGHSYDMFGRTVANGFGTADRGGNWTTISQFGVIAASDFNVANGAATTLHTSDNTVRGGYLGDVNLQDVTVSMTVSAAVPTGNSVDIGQILLRGVSSTEWIRCGIIISSAAGNALTMHINDKDGAGLATRTRSDLSHTALTHWRIKASVIGSTIAMKVWAANGVEPADWQLTATNPDPVASGWVGFVNYRVTGNTNANYVVSTYDFHVDNPQRIEVVRSVNGITKSWPAGNDVRLWNPAILGR